MKENIIVKANNSYLFWMSWVKNLSIALVLFLLLLTSGHEAYAQQILRIDIGSSSNTTDANGNVWLADTPFVSGAGCFLFQQVNGSGALENGQATERQLRSMRQWQNQPGDFRTQCFGAIRVPVNNGQYRFRIYHAELQPGIDTGGNRRQMDVWIQNGQRFFDNHLTIAAAGGPGRVAQLSGEVNVTDGMLQVDVRAEEFNPLQIAAMEIEAISPGSGFPDNSANTGQSGNTVPPPPPGTGTSSAASVALINQLGSVITGTASNIRAMLQLIVRAPNGTSVVSDQTRFLNLARQVVTNLLSYENLLPQLAQAGVSIDATRKNFMDSVFRIFLGRMPQARAQIRKNTIPLFRARRAIETGKALKILRLKVRKYDPESW